MPLFIDPKARVRLEFPDDHEIEDLRGEWIEVRESISNAQWQEIRAGAVSAAMAGVDWHMAFNGENGMRRAAYWIEAVSFSDGRGRSYPNQNVVERIAWLGAMWPPAYNAMVELLDAYVEKAWAVAQPVAHPLAGESSDPTPTERTSPETTGSGISGTF